MRYNFVRIRYSEHISSSFQNTFRVNIVIPHTLSYLEKNKESFLSNTHKDIRVNFLVSYNIWYLCFRVWIWKQIRKENYSMAEGKNLSLCCNKSPGTFSLSISWQYYKLFPIHLKENIWNCLTICQEQNKLIWTLAINMYTTVHKEGKLISVEEQLRLIRLQKDFHTSQKKARARLKRNG